MAVLFTLQLNLPRYTFTLIFPWAVVFYVDINRTMFREYFCENSVNTACKGALIFIKTDRNTSLTVVANKTEEDIRKMKTERNHNVNQRRTFCWKQISKIEITTNS